jgi:hypothetical protein
MGVGVRDVGGLVGNLELVEDCNKQTVMQIAREEHSEELLKIFNHGAEQMETAALKPATEDESRFRCG